MKEIKSIIEAYNQALAAGKKSVLVTMVHLDGSSYRRPGARMLVTEDGQMTGAISGGCLEGDALRKALLVMARQQAKLVTYDTTDEDDAILGAQLGCNGIIQVLIEPIDPNDPCNPIQLLKQATARRQKGVLVTLFNLENRLERQWGTCMFMGENNDLWGNAGFTGLSEVLQEDAALVLQHQKSAFKNYIGATEHTTAFIEYVKPPVALVILGAGNDVIPLVEMADTLGWEVHVIDGRSNLAKRERFESACQVLVSKPEHVLEQITIDEQTVFALMTHNYNYDLAMLEALVRKNVVYIGVLGPRKKLDRMLNDMREEGIILTDAQLASIYGPVGLEIGAETAEEIALSILAEIKAVLAHKAGSFLRNRAEVIHFRSDTIIEEKRLV